MFRYVDIFCGIGGFHQGVDRVSIKRNFESTCIFAADNDFYAAKVYERNYGMNAFYDLTKDETHQQIAKALENEKLTCLFAGFPCQPFSKAGDRQGFDNQIKGTLFFELVKIVSKHMPTLILLENVRNLKNHDEGNTWTTIRESLVNLGYSIEHTIISPNSIKKIPALRERFFIMAFRNDIPLNEKMSRINELNQVFIKTSIFTHSKIEYGLKNVYFNKNERSNIDPKKIEVIEMWNELYHLLKVSNRNLISPLWPRYFTSTNYDDMPEWKIKIIKKNQDWYSENKEIYDSWYSKNRKLYDSLKDSSKKFEWNAGDDISDIWEGIIQFRPSGVRVKKPDFIPTLVAINQTPILGVEKRYILPEEISKIYGFKRLKFGDQPAKESYKQLGNTVSVDVVEHLLEYMLNRINYGGTNHGEEN